MIEIALVFVGLAGSVDRPLVAYERTGGFAGVRETLVVRRSGRVNGLRRAFRLAPRELTELRAVLARARFATLASRYRARVRIADGFLHRVTYGGRSVLVEDGARPPPRLRRLLDRLAVLSARGPQLSVAASAAAPPPASATVARSLRAAARTGRLPQALLIRYDDVATRFGGDTFVLRADGRLTKTSPGPTDAPETRTVRTTRRSVLRVVRLLVRLEAWRQVTPPRRLLPDETRAYLSVRVGGARTVVWEWYNDLERNRRLSLVKASLSSSFVAASGR